MQQDEVLDDDIDFLIAENAKKPVHPPGADIAEWVESRRVMSGSSPHPGPYRLALTPFLREILEFMSPFSPVTDIAVQKSAQLGLSCLVESILCFYIGECPTSIVYCSATQELLTEWSTRRLEDAIDSCGIRHLIGPQTENTKSRQTGDRVLSKAFRGGSIALASAQAASSLRSSSRRILIADETDGAPPILLKTSEGNYLDVAAARTFAYGHRAKRLFISTPGEAGLSLIARKHDLGDARRFMVKCVFCQHEQELRLGNEQSNFGLKPEYQENGVLAAVSYQCAHCGQLMEEFHKPALLASGRWVATKLSSAPTFVSYQLSGLYSPFLSWQALYQNYLNSRDDQESLRSFYNLALGEVFTPSGSRPDFKSVISNRGTWHAGTIPSPEILWTTSAVDVMRGSERDPATGRLRDPSNPPRLELLICGHGAGSRMWYLLHKIFEGDVSNSETGAWEDFFQFCAKGGLTLRRVQDGRAFSSSIMLIDCADSLHAEAVFSFCETRMTGSVFPYRGMAYLADKKKGDAPTRSTAGQRYRWSNTGIQAHRIVLVATWGWKTVLMNRLRIERNPQDPQKPGFQDMPLETTDEEYAQILSEERHIDGSWHTVREANHMLDLSTANFCAGTLHLDSLIAFYRTEMQRKGAPPQMLAMIDWKFVLAKLQAGEQTR